MAGICGLDNMENLTTYSIGTEVRYFYQPCVASDEEAAETARNCRHCFTNSNRTLSCAQFCDKFEGILPPIYFSVSLISAICCLGVILTYFSFPRLRRSGYSSKVFLYRTLVDLVIALGHITAMIFSLPQAESKSTLAGCRMLGVINEVALVASNLWYVMLALDLIKAIRNPFSSQPSYKPFSHLIVWGFSFICGVVLILLTARQSPGEAGQSMFFWCWVSVGTTVNLKSERRKLVPSFAAVTLFLYYFWHFSFWIFSLCVLIAAAWILRGHLAASSETRKFVLKQNFIYVLVLGIETAIIMPIWITQLSVTKNRISALRPNHKHYNTYYPYYFTYTDLGLAIAFAVVHSLRGTIDFFIWFGTFTIGYADIKQLRHRLRNKFSKPHEDWIPQNFHSHSVKQDNAVNRALRRNAMYCINIGILDAIASQLESRQVVTDRIGIVDDSYIDASLIQSEENQQPEDTAEPYRNPRNREQNLRKICFPAASSLLGITSFSFIDLEPSVFSLLRSCYGIDTLAYRASFRIKNAADIESSGMLEKFTEGKSGSFFYFTKDFKYIIKTVTDAEERFLQRIAFRYYDHMKNNPNSLIVRFLGLHKVRLAQEQRYITVVVMENIFYNTEQFKMHERYDLKGSRVGRRSVKKTSKIRREYKGTLKDLDLGDKKIHVGTDSKPRLMEQFRRDIEFLVRCKIMDYSLLLGIHNHSAKEKIDRAKLRDDSSKSKIQSTEVDHDMLPLTDLQKHPPTDSTVSSGYGTRTNTIDTDLDDAIDGENPVKCVMARQTQTAWFRADFGGHRSTSALHPLSPHILQPLGHSISDQSHQGATDTTPATYYFGIVDILQEFNLRKKCEHHWKTKVTCQDKHGISCVNELEYGERFLNFMDEIFD